MKIKYIAFLFLLLAGLVGCTKEEGPEVSAKRTVLVYMIANNNLDSYGRNNLNSMIAGATAKNLNGGNLIVYHAPKGENPSLIQIKEGANGIVTQHLIKEYAPQNAVDPEVMQSVIREVIERFPADSYGLDLWSHGTAWLPIDYKNMLRSFGDDAGKQMEIDELAKGIPDNFFDFILFDACYMASAECVYELRHKANYILASPTETMADGFPYQTIIPYFFAETPQLEKAAEAFYTHYNNQTGLSQSGTVSLTKTSELDKLADIVKEILADKSESDIFALPLSQMQVLERLSYNGPFTLYDLGDFVSHLATTDQYARFKACIDNAILYKNHTEKAFFVTPYRMYPITSFSGLSVYVPQQSIPKLNEWYKGLEWYKAVYK